MRRAKSRWACAFLSCLLFAPSSPGSADTTSIWDIVVKYTNEFEQLVLISGYTKPLDECGLGKPFYTAFIPMDDSLRQYLEENQLTIADISVAPEVADSFVSDHVMNGSLDQEELLDEAFLHVETWSGRKIVKSSTQPSATLEVGVNLLMNNQFVVFYGPACNGYVYLMSGKTYSPTTASLAGRATIDALNVRGAPRGTQRPARPWNEVASELPETR